VEASSPAETEVLKPQGDGDGEVETRAQGWAVEARSEWRRVEARSEWRPPVGSKGPDA